MVLLLSSLVVVVGTIQFFCGVFLLGDIHLRRNVFPLRVVCLDVFLFFVCSHRLFHYIVSLCRNVLVIGAALICAVSSLCACRTPIGFFGICGFCRRFFIINSFDRSPFFINYFQNWFFVLNNFRKCLFCVH